MTDDEVDSEISKLARVTGWIKINCANSCMKNSNRRFATYILSRKVVEFLLANAKIGEEGFLTRLMGGGRKPAENASD